MSKNLIKQLSHVSLTSRNLNKVILFYVEILGFKIIHKFVNQKKEVYGLFLSSYKRTMLEFFLTNKKVKKSLKFRHICFEVSNIYKLANKLKKKGYNIKISRGKTDKTLNFNIKDLEHNEVEFHQYDKYSKVSKFLK